MSSIATTYSRARRTASPTMPTTEEDLSNNVTRVASPVDHASILLHTQLAGTFNVLTKTDGPKYEAEITSWNKDVCKHKPDMIVQPETTEEVAVIVKAANQFGARLVIAGGRHGHDCLAEGALVCDMSKMKKVTVDKEAMTCTVEGGCKLGDMDKACQPYGVGCVTGTNPDTGVVGLSTAGGGGYLSRRHGAAVDNFVAATVVLASGEIVVATKDNAHADLLWGLQGAGSNFGVVTSLTMKAHPIDHVYGGQVVNMALRPSTAKGILAHWRDWIVGASRSVMSVAVLPCGAPVVPMVVVETNQADVPQDAAGAKVKVKQLPALAPAFSRMGSFGACASMKMMKRMQYHSELQPMLESLQASGHYYDASCIVPKLSQEVIDVLVDFTRVQHVNSHASILVFPLSGAMADPKVGETSFYAGGRPKEAFWIIIEGKWEPKSEKEGVDSNRAAVVDWVKRLRAALAAFDVTDTAHTLDGNMEKSLGGAEAIFGPNLARLQQVKAKYDPENFFKCNRNIMPA